MSYQRGFFFCFFLFKMTELYATFRRPNQVKTLVDAFISVQICFSILKCIRNYCVVSKDGELDGKISSQGMPERRKSGFKRRHF